MAYTTTTLYRLADKAMGGNLADELARWARAGVSQRAAARLLSEALEVDISHETARRWLKEARS